MFSPHPQISRLCISQFQILSFFPPCRQPITTQRPAQSVASVSTLISRPVLAYTTERTTADDLKIETRVVCSIRVSSRLWLCKCKYFANVPTLSSLGTQDSVRGALGSECSHTRSRPVALPLWLCGCAGIILHIRLTSDGPLFHTHATHRQLERQLSLITTKTRSVSLLRTLVQKCLYPHVDGFCSTAAPSRSRPFIRGEQLLEVSDPYAHP